MMYRFHMTIEWSNEVRGMLLNFKSIWFLMERVGWYQELGLKSYEFLMGYTNGNLKTLLVFFEVYTEFFSWL